MDAGTSLGNHDGFKTGYTQRYGELARREGLEPPTLRFEGPKKRQK
jgi:hypothetical protein